MWVGKRKRSGREPWEGSIEDPRLGHSPRRGALHDESDNCRANSRRERAPGVGNSGHGTNRFGTGRAIKVEFTYFTGERGSAHLEFNAPSACPTKIMKCSADRGRRLCLVAISSTRGEDPIRIKEPNRRENRKGRKGAKPPRVGSLFNGSDFLHPRV